jgi:hypothetical protein
MDEIQRVAVAGDLLLRAAYRSRVLEHQRFNARMGRYYAFDPIARFCRLDNGCVPQARQDLRCLLSEQVLATAKGPERADGRRIAIGKPEIVEK